MADLLSFYEATKIGAEDRSALESHHVKDIESLQAMWQSIHSNSISSVSSESHGKLRALLHYLDSHDEFDKDAFETHLLLNADEMAGINETVSTSSKKELEASKGFVPMCDQGFDPSEEGREDADEHEEVDNEMEENVGPEEVLYGNILFKKGCCYQTKGKDGNLLIVGIRSFIVKDGTPTEASCVMIEPMTKTFLGQGKNDDFELYSSKYVQVWTERSTRQLSELRDSCPDPIKTMPKICYQPQKTKSDRWFAYFYDTDCCKRIGLRENNPKVIELFCGSGGMHLGLKANNFETIKAVDLNANALKTFCSNNPEEAHAVEQICVNEYLTAYKYNGVTELLQASSPCQGASKANRNIVESESDKKNNELMLSFPRALRQTQALTGIFENVDGVWSKKCMPYLRRMLFELAEMNYQFRTMVLRACDYGDAQKRPRFIIFASRHFVPLPLPPRPTHSEHGIVPGTLPWVTTGDVLDMHHEVPDDHFPNMNDRETSQLQPGDNDFVQLEADKLSPAIRASGPAIFHYQLDRDGNRQCTSVRDRAVIQGYPNGYEFFGNQGDKYRQVGNSVPVGFATAISRSVANVLRFVYRGEEIDTNIQKKKEGVREENERLRTQVDQLKRRLEEEEEINNKRKMRKDELPFYFS